MTEVGALHRWAAEQLAIARGSDAGRAARTVHGGRGHALRQTIVALVGGRALAEHENPGEATLLVLSGRIRLSADERSWEAAAGDYLAIPPARHAMTAIDDAVVLLTVVAIDGSD